MSMTVSRKSAGVNKLKDLFKELLRPQGFHVPASRGYEKRTLTQVELHFQLQQRGNHNLDTC